MAREPDLARLILDAKGSRSYERLSIDCGGLPTDKRLQQMATTGLKAFPDLATIRGLARGIGTTETAVVLAAARSLGLRVHSGEDPGALVIGGADDLRPEQKEAVVALVRVFREMNTDARRRRLEAVAVAGQQRYEAITDLLTSVPIDGPNRTRERAIITRAAIEAQEELESLGSTKELPSELASQLDGLRDKWKTVVDGLVAMTAKYPPFSDVEDVTRSNLSRVIHGTAGSGKALTVVDWSLSRVPEPEYDAGPHQDAEDYDEEAASWSPERVGQPEPEQP